jgi:hypothetical protein
MTTRIAAGSDPSVLSLASAERVTAPPGRPFKAVMGAGARAILSGAEQVVTSLPGGPILAAALRPTAETGGGSAASVSSSSAALTPEGSSGTGGVGSASTPGSDNGGVEATLNQSANQNLYFIEIQERISAESRSYSAISNVLKARHDTVKNAIGNIR